MNPPVIFSASSTAKLSPENLQNELIRYVLSRNESIHYHQVFPEEI
jgi:hypothetical protein